MLQSAQGHQIIQTASGQQLVVQSLPTGQHVQVRSSRASILKAKQQQKIRSISITFIKSSLKVVSSGADGAMQQVQVLPMQSTAGTAGQPIMLQSQVIQTADGQTLIYQPVQMQDGTQAVVQQPAQLAQSAAGQVIQLAAPQSTVSVAQQPQATTTTTTSSVQQQQQGNQNIIMMVPGAAGGSPTIQRIPLPGKSLKRLLLADLY